MFGRRQRHARGHRDSGDDRHRSAARGARSDDTVVVPDEFGADDLAPLRDGCACCTVRVKLQDSAARLLADARAGQVAHSPAIVIETARATPDRSCARSRPARARKPTSISRSEPEAQIARHCRRASFTLTRRRAARLGCIQPLHRDAHRRCAAPTCCAPRAAQCRGLPRAGRGAARAAPRASAGGARGMAGRRSPQPRSTVR